MPFKRRLLRAALALAGSALPIAAWPQAWPNKAVRLVVPYAAGGGVDTVGRAIAQQLTESLGQAVLIDNRPGANSVIGTEQVARSPADGHTLLVTLVSHYAMPFLSRNVRYDPVKDFTPITIIGKAPQAMFVNPSTGIRSVKELIDYARKNPGKVSYATSGAGTSQHLGGELLNHAAGIDMAHVPYKGGPPAVTDLIAGQVSLMFETGPGILPHVRSGKLRALGVGSVRRSAATPDLPTIAEQGFPGFDGVAWIGFVAPAGVPRPIVDKLAAETAAIIALPEVRERLLALGAEPGWGTPDDFAAYMKSEIAKWGKVIKESGAKVE
jgi:tripartite-type tricarboxylate transporter receptor subunit TctC